MVSAAKIGNDVAPRRVRRPKAPVEVTPKRRRADATTATKSPRAPVVLDEGGKGETQTIGTTSETLSGQFGFGNFRPADPLDTVRHVAAKFVSQPGPMLRSRVGLAGELLKVLAGLSTLAREPGDKRFADPAWRENWAYRGMMQSYPLSALARR